MLLPKDSKNDILKELDELIGIGKSLIASTKHARAMEAEHLRRSGIVDLRSDRVPPDRVKFGSWETRIKILARRILDKSDYQDVLNNIQNAKETLNVASVEDILGILIGMKTALESGSLDHVFKSTVTNTVNEHANSLNDPHKQPAPDDRIARVYAFALDLAWGYRKKLWGQQFVISQARSGEWWHSQTNHESQSRLDGLLMGKWKSEFPEYVELHSQGFLDSLKHGKGGPTVYLNTTALSLLEKQEPTQPLKAFIAYKRSESAGLASFLEEGLENADFKVEVFTDKKIPLGDNWQERLEQSVRDCDVFICLFSTKTLESDYVRDEINWALDSDSRFIPILHNGYKGEGDYAELLQKLQGPPVYEESIKAYEFTLIDLLRTLRNLHPQD